MVTEWQVVGIERHKGEARISMPRSMIYILWQYVTVDASINRYVHRVYVYAGRNGICSGIKWDFSRFEFTRDEGLSHCIFVHSKACTATKKRTTVVLVHFDGLMYLRNVPPTTAKKTAKINRNFFIIWEAEEKCSLLIFPPQLLSMKCLNISASLHTID